jgi:dephospho-CoA kinase
VVFADPAARRDLEAIVHPLVQAATEAWYRSLDPSTPFAVSDIPLLYEIGREVDFDAVVVAACAPDVQLARLRARDGLSDEQARRRIAAQRPIDEKVRRADYVISTEGSLLDTERATEAVWRALRARQWNGSGRAPGRPPLGGRST